MRSGQISAFVLAALSIIFGCQSDQRTPDQALPPLPILLQKTKTVQSLRPSADKGAAAGGADTLSATMAGFARDGRRLFLATPGPEPRLVIRPWPPPLAPDRDKWAEQPLALPPVRTDLKVDWQWSVSPNGRWVIVRRGLSMQHYWPHGLDKQHEAAEAQVQWIGFIDLETNQAVPLPAQPTQFFLQGKLAGWQGNRALLQLDQCQQLVAVSPAEPTRLETMIEMSGSLGAVSPDGNYAVVYDGAEGDVKVTLWQLGRGPVRGLFEDPLKNHGSYAAGGSAHVAFSNDGRWMLVAKRRHMKGTKWAWHAAVEIQSIDGRQVAYRDEFTVPESNSFLGPIPCAAPGDEARFAYWRFREGGKAELAVVHVKDGKGTSRTHVPTVPPVVNGCSLAPLQWSSAADRVAWTDGQRALHVWEPASGVVQTLGTIDKEVMRWQWAPAAVAGD